MTNTIDEKVSEYVLMKQRLGYRYAHREPMLRNFAQYSLARGDQWIQTKTAIEWVMTSEAKSQRTRANKLSAVRGFARWLNAEDERHEVPPTDVLGRCSRRRQSPSLISKEDINKLLSAALKRPPVNSIAPLTWYYLFGLIASTGMRISEALSLQLNDITPDGIIIRKTKFGKSRLIVLHPTTWDALNRYLEVRCQEKTSDNHLFVVTTGTRPNRVYASTVFRNLAEQVGIRKTGIAQGPTPKSLRHAFAIRSLESLQPDADVSRHMLALATYLGHSRVSDTYWYLQATPRLLRSIAKATETAHVIECGGCHD